jgi:hypothetical protein
MGNDANNQKYDAEVKYYRNITQKGGPKRGKKMQLRKEKAIN